MENTRPNKRPRRKMQSKLDDDAATVSNIPAEQLSTTTTLSTCPDSPVALNDLLLQKRWVDAMDRLAQRPEEAADSATRPSALAVACRQGAPADLVKRLLLAAPHRLRELLDSRGTPLHEAISCESTSMETMRALLRTDELLDDHYVAEAASAREYAIAENILPSTRATLMQDVDGFTPLHLLIRRRFQWHVLTEDDTNDGDRNLMMPMLEALVQSCPESVVVPDRGEYEEAPIVYALKANIYAPAVADGDAHFVKVEACIYEMVQTMLLYAPFAATQTFSGFRGDYTALHSAVFHGRYTSTIELLLDTEAAEDVIAAAAAASSSPRHKAALLKNTQAELPLHFCAMRGERPRTVALLAKNAPQAVLQRDSSGLTPFHWLWVRFMSTLMAMEDQQQQGQQDEQQQQQQRGAEERFDIPVAGSDASAHENDPYNDFANLEQDDFETDLRLIRRLDPPVDFLRMRHIPDDVAKISPANCHEWLDDIQGVLHQARTRHQGRTANNDADAVAVQSWTRMQAVTALFWTKVVSMLRATKSELVATTPFMAEDAGLVHAAFVSQCCPPPIARLAALLFPHELVAADGSRRLPVHYAAQRKFHAWDWLREDGLSPAQTIVTAAGDLLRNESLQALRDAIELSPREAMRVADSSNRLVIHHVIGTFIHACCQPARSSSDGSLEEIIRILHDLVSIYPECLSRRDGVSKLHPFLQSVACATEQAKNQMFIDQKNSLNITYVLLRENPAVLCSLLPRRR